MPQRVRWLAVLAIIAVFSLAGCARATADADPGGHSAPAVVEHVEGSTLSRVTLTARAAERLGIETAPVRDEQVDGAQRWVIPYSAVLYDEKGDTWVYINPEPLVFIRHQVLVVRIEGEHAMLSDGPDAGTAVVTVGAAELLGTEYEVGH